MNWDALLLLSALEGTPKEREINFGRIIDGGVDRTFFEEPKLMDFAQKHRRRYGKYPDVNTFRAKFALKNSKVYEPLGFYIEGLREEKQRRIMMAAYEQADFKFHDGDIKAGMAIISSGLKKAEAVTSRGDDLSVTASVDERLDSYIERIKNPGINGIPSGLERLDKRTYGWQKGEFNLITARLGSMKTWMLLFMAKAALESGARVVIATIEMGKLQVARRLDSLLTETRFENIRSGVFPSKKEEAAFKVKMRGLKKLKNDIVIVGGAGFSASYLEQKIIDHRPDILFVDGLYMMMDEEGAKAHWEQMFHVSRRVKILAEDMEIPINATSQLHDERTKNKGSTGKEDTGDIMYAKALAQNADNVVTLGRIYNEVEEDYTNRLWVNTPKLREGEGVRFQAEIDFNTMEVTEHGEYSDETAPSGDKEVEEIEAEDFEL